MNIVDLKYELAKFPFFRRANRAEAEKGIDDHKNSLISVENP